MAKKREEIKIVLKHKTNLYFVARVIQSGESHIARTSEDDSWYGDFRRAYFKREREWKRKYPHLDFPLKDVKFLTKKDYIRKSYLLPWRKSHWYEELEDGLFKVECCQGNELRNLRRWKKTKKSDRLVIVDNLILKAKSDENINFDILIADYNKNEPLRLNALKYYSMLHFINMPGYFLIIAFLKPGAEKRVLRQYLKNKNVGHK